MAAAAAAAEPLDSRLVQQPRVHGSPPQSPSSSSSHSPASSSPPQPHQKMTMHSTSLRSPDVTISSPMFSDRSWDEIISGRIPSEYDRTTWQQWVDFLQAAMEDQLSLSSPVSSSSSSSGSSSDSPSLSSSSSAASLRDSRQLVPPLNYPQSGLAPAGSASQEAAAANSKALEEASRVAFGGPSLRKLPQRAAKAQRLAASNPRGGSFVDAVKWQRGSQPLQSLQSLHNLNQVIFDPEPPDVDPSKPAEGPITTPPRRGSGDIGDNDSLLAVLLPLLVLLAALLFLLLLFLVLLILVRRRARIALSSRDGPLDVAREEELEGMGGLDGVEERWLDTVDDPTRRGYARAKDWLLSHPPASVPSEITMSQFLSIQEKGVSAWSFEPDYEANSSCYVEARTEITFLADGQGMATQEGGGCSVQSNLPLPKINEVYYWEAKMFTKPDTTGIAVGLATKPYPSFRLPGWSKFSVGYFSRDGFKCHNYPFAEQSYGPAYVQGDVIGVGYRPRTGTVFYTRNGRKLEDAFVGLNRYNLFPTIGADGPAEVHVNLGQAGFVFIEANVKKWGLAPMVGTLAPPPAYGQERGSILIEAAGQSSSAQYEGRRTPPPPPTPPGEDSPSLYRSGVNRSSRASRRQAMNAAIVDQRPREEGNGGSRDRMRSISASSSASEGPANPPTPGHLDISLHSLVSAQPGPAGETDDTDGSGSSTRSSTLRGNSRSNGTSGSDTGSYFPPTPTARTSSHEASSSTSGRDNGSRKTSRGALGGSGAASSTASSGASRSPSPPPYSEGTFPPPSGLALPATPSSRLHRDSSYSSSSTGGSGSGSLGGTPEHNSQARRSSGRTHRLANSVLGALLERGYTSTTPQTPGSGAWTGAFFVAGEGRDLSADRNALPRPAYSAIDPASSAGEPEYEARGSGSASRSRSDFGWADSVFRWWSGTGSGSGSTNPPRI